MDRKQSELLDQAPPHSLEAERGVVGAILIDPTRLDEVPPIVRPSDFYVPDLGNIFEHLLAFPFNGDGSADLTALLAWIRKPEEAKKLSPVIAELFNLHPSPKHAADYARTIRGHANKRRLIRLHTEGLQAAYGSENGTAELVAGVGRIVWWLQSRATAGSGRAGRIVESGEEGGTQAPAGSLPPGTKGGEAPCLDDHLPHVDVPAVVGWYRTTSATAADHGGTAGSRARRMTKSEARNGSFTVRRDEGGFGNGLLPDTRGSVQSINVTARRYPAIN